MVPTTLDEWSRDLVKKLLTTETFEKDWFDFNQQLPHPAVKEDKLGLSAACAAFANAAGGFLVFGVKDDRKLSPDDRLVGVEAKDFPEQFGNYPAKCSPSVDWDFKSIPLPSGRFIQVVHLPISWRAPHAVEPKEGMFQFPKRTNKGTEYMTFSEVQAMFLDLQEKRRKLEMLRAELLFLAQLLTNIVPQNVNSMETSTITPPMEVLQVLIGEPFVLLEQKPELLNALNDVRRLALEIEEVHADYQRQLSLALAPASISYANPINPTGRETRNHNALLKRNGEWMLDAIKKAQRELATLLAS